MHVRSRRRTQEWLCLSPSSSRPHHRASHRATTTVIHQLPTTIFIRRRLWPSSQPYHPVTSIRAHRPQAHSTASTSYPDGISTTSSLLWSPWFYVKCQGWTHPFNVLVTSTFSWLSSPPTATLRASPPELAASALPSRACAELPAALPDLWPSSSIPSTCWGNDFHMAIITA